MTGESLRRCGGGVYWLAAPSGLPMAVYLIRVASDGLTARVERPGSGLRLWVRCEIVFSVYLDALNACGAWVNEMWDYDDDDPFVGPDGSQVEG